MTAAGVYIKDIIQKDNFTFTIEWSDGAIIDYRLSDLQQRCPCAACIDEITGGRQTGIPAVSTDVRAIRLTSVGRYALRIQFSAGCSNGIYSFAMLRGFKNA